MIEGATRVPPMLLGAFLSDDCRDVRQAREAIA